MEAKELQQQVAMSMVPMWSHPSPSQDEVPLFSSRCSSESKIPVHIEMVADYSSIFYIFELQYITHLNIEPDELHTMHLGTSMCMLGIILCVLIFQMLDGSLQ